MSAPNERPILIFILLIISIGIVLCLSGLATPGWNGHSVFTVATVSGVLTIISVLLLIVCFIMVGILLSGAIVHQYLPFVFLSILIISSIVMLGAFSSFYTSTSNYSYSLMVAAFTFTYLSSIIATFWLFGVRDSRKSTTISGKYLQPRLEVLT